MPEVILPCPTNGCAGIGKIYHLPDQLYVTMLCVTCGLSTGYVINPEEAIARWNKLPRALTWTHEPPKIEGQYWQRKIGYPQSATIASIDDFGSGMRCKSTWGDRTIEKWSEFEWAGPIAPPVE